MKTLNEAELLSIKRLKQKGVPISDIAQRIGITKKRVETILKTPISKMKTLLTITLLIIFSKAFSQSYDNATSLLTIDKLHVLVTNNQNCSTAFQVTLFSGRTFTTPVVAPDSSTIIVLDVCCIVSVIPLTNCSEIVPTVVHVNTCDFVLGVSGITTFEANRSGKGVEVLLRLVSETNVGRIEILTSTDKKYFIPALEFKPQGKLTYYLNIKN